MTFFLWFIIFVEVLCIFCKLHDLYNETYPLRRKPLTIGQDVVHVLISFMVFVWACTLLVIGG